MLVDNYCNISSGSPNTEKHARMKNNSIEHLSEEGNGLTTTRPWLGAPTGPTPDPHTAPKGLPLPQEDPALVLPTLQ